MKYEKWNRSSLPCSPEKQHRGRVTTIMGNTYFTAVNTDNAAEDDNQTVYEFYKYCHVALCSGHKYANYCCS